jgi:hypothetical protein
VEDDAELRVEVVAQRLPLQDGGEAFEQRQRVLDVGDAAEALVHELLQQRLQLGDLHVELDAVAVERVVAVVQQVVLLLLQGLQHAREVEAHVVHALQLVRGQRLELPHRREQVDQLDDAPAEEVELAEDRHLVEVELLSVRGGQQLVLGHAVLLLHVLVQPQALVHAQQQSGGVASPDRVRRLCAVEVQLTLGHHLVGDLREQHRHALARAIVPPDRVHHLDRVHQRWHRVDDVAHRP